MVATTHKHTDYRHARMLVCRQSRRTSSRHHLTPGDTSKHNGRRTGMLSWNRRTHPGCLRASQWVLRVIKGGRHHGDRRLHVDRHLLCPDLICLSASRAGPCACVISTSSQSAITHPPPAFLEPAGACACDDRSGRSALIPFGCSDEN